MAAGIYKILNVITQKFYIGSAINIKDRWRIHKIFLKANNHDNSYLQKSWNKYGENAFWFLIIEVVEDKTKLIEREQHWMDKTQCCNRKIGYNILPFAGSVLGYKHSEETKAKFRKIKSNVSIETRTKMAKAKIGKTHTEEHNRKIALAGIGKKPTVRRLDKWPHDKGNKCKCTDCKLKTNENMRAYYAKYKIQRMIQL